MLRSMIRHYVYGLFAASWNGGISSVAAILGIDALAATGADQMTHILNWHEMVSAFIGALGVHAILWLKAHPLPETFDTHPPFSKP